MRKFYKICGILAGVLAACGFSLCLAGTIVGASLPEMVSKGEFSIGYDGNDMIADRPSSEVSEDASVFSVDQVKNLEISGEFGEINLYTDETDTISVESIDGDGKYTAKLQGNTLRISQNEGVHSFAGIGETPVIDIYIPEFFYFDTVTFDMDAGSIYADSIKARLVRAEVDAGSVICNDYSVERLSVEVDTGSAEFYGGNFTDNAELSCDAGRIILYVGGAEDSLNYDLEAELGSLEINGRSYGGFSHEQRISNGADRTLKAEVEAGSLEIYTE